MRKMSTIISTRTSVCKGVKEALPPGMTKNLRISFFTPRRLEQISLKSQTIIYAVQQACLRVAAELQICQLAIKNLIHFMPSTPLKLLGVWISIKSQITGTTHSICLHISLMRKRPLNWVRWLSKRNILTCKGKQANMN